MAKSDDSATSLVLSLGVGVGVGLGIIIGAALGSAFGAVGNGVALGVCFGPVVGLAVAAVLSRSKINSPLIKFLENEIDAESRLQLSRFARVFRRRDSE